MRCYETKLFACTRMERSSNEMKEWIKYFLYLRVDRVEVYGVRGEALHLLVECRGTRDAARADRLRVWLTIGRRRESRLDYAA